jgi:hypothetical protein
LMGDDDGRRLIDAADLWMARQGARNPGRMTAMVAPGKWGPPSGWSAGE